MRVPIFILTAALFLMSVSGCGLVGSWVARLTAVFQVLSSDKRIVYEKGAEAFAEETSRELPKAMMTVESRQFGAFKEPVRIYVFASAESFAKFANVPEVVKGAGVGNEVYLSGQLLNKMGELRGMLTHELSHIQLSQTLGTVTFNRTLPRWFREGLAIHVADGGGATNATEAETIANFLQQKYFAPETKGALLNLKLPGPKGLEPKVFYRQSGMFVHFLAHNYPGQFERFVKSLQEGKDFEELFSQCFECEVSTMLQTFIATLRLKTERQSSRCVRSVV